MKTKEQIIHDLIFELQMQMDWANKVDDEYLDSESYLRNDFVAEQERARETIEEAHEVLNASRT